MLFFWTLAHVQLLALAGAVHPLKREYAKYDVYVLEHVQIPGVSVHDSAHALGLEILEPAGALKNHWIARIEKLSTRSTDGPVEDRILTRLGQLRAQARLSPRAHPDISASIRHLEKQTLRRRVKRAPIDLSNTSASAGVAAANGINDPLYPEQWHLVNDLDIKHSMNVAGAWAMNITGKGVIAAMVDDGVDFEHDDIATNFWAKGSYDFNDHVALPKPMLASDSHGTRCAGQIAAVKNDACGMGIAFESKIAGVRILSGELTDLDEASSLNYGYQETSVYSCSWGPSDDGATLEAPGYLIKKSIVEGITSGRGGKGSVFVFASGNGESHGDTCNHDGYTNSIFSVTISAVSDKGKHPYYSESCSANMVAAYSSGGARSIATTDIHGKCTKGSAFFSTTQFKLTTPLAHGGTSAAAPNASGVFVLALQARPDLTWRDIQYLCIETARMINADEEGWELLASGKLYNYKYGFGVLDATAYVKAAMNWTLVPPQAWLELPTIQILEGTSDTMGNMTGGSPIPPGGIESKQIVTKEMMEKNNLAKIEQVTVRVWITHTRRGAVEVYLISPTGIKSVLATSRRKDMSKEGWPGWSMMTLKHWGEDGVGEWTVGISDGGVKNHNGTFHGWSLSMYGTSIDSSKAKAYEIPLVDNLLPSDQELKDKHLPVTDTTKVHPKPTAHLSITLDRSDPTSMMTSSLAATAAPSVEVVHENKEGYGSGVLSFATGAIALGALVGGIWFAVKTVKERRDRRNYSTVAHEEIPMHGLTSSVLEESSDDGGEGEVVEESPRLYRDIP